MYRKLDVDKTIKTIEKLKDRISERFSNSGLSMVCNELIDISKESRERMKYFIRPILSVRFIIFVVILASLFALVYSAMHIKFKSDVFTWGELMQVIEAGINNVILIGAALLFLVSFETRLKRRRALEALYELRAIAHVIDMHQLTKDPSKIVLMHTSTPSSPTLALTPYELTRYLDYSSEMLSLVGKLAAIYGENMRDEIVLSAVNEIEELTTGLSRKIWQKIDILNKFHGGGDYGETVVHTIAS